MKKFCFTAINLILFMMEWIPYGVVLRFGNPDGEPFVQTFSYFSLTPYGYGNIGPFLTASLTCILLLLSIVFLFNQSDKIIRSIRTVSIFATATAFLPLLFFGVSYFTFLGLAIGILLALEFVFCFLYKRN